MKRRREEVEMVPSEIRSAINELSTINFKLSGAAPAAATAQVPLKPFLALCYLLIQVLDKIGPTMAVLRQDIHQNILRLEKFHESDPSVYWDVVEILKKEVSEGNARKGPTCSKSFVWLTRSLVFSVALLELLVKDFEKEMEQIVEETYNITLKPWHGWISQTAYRVALKLVPDTQSLVSILKSSKEEEEDCDKLKEEILNLTSLLNPMLDQINHILRIYGLDKLKST